MHKCLLRCLAVVSVLIVSSIHHHQQVVRGHLCDDTSLCHFQGEKVNVKYMHVHVSKSPILCLISTPCIFDPSYHTVLNHDLFHTVGWYVVYSICAHYVSYFVQCFYEGIHVLGLILCTFTLGESSK